MSRSGRARHGGIHRPDGGRRPGHVRRQGSGRPASGRSRLSRQYTPRPPADTTATPVPRRMASPANPAAPAHAGRDARSRQPILLSSPARPAGPLPPHHAEDHHAAAFTPSDFPANSGGLWPDACLRGGGRCPCAKPAAADAPLPVPAIPLTVRTRSPAKHWHAPAAPATGRAPA